MLENFQKIIKRMAEEDGIEAVILGCTELPLVLNDEVSPVPCLDTMKIHIQRLIDWIAETIAISVYLSKYHTFLFRLLMNCVEIVVFGILFFRRAKSRVVYVGSVIASTLLFYFVLYHGEVSMW